MTLLEQRVEAGDSEAMWMLGLCSSFKLGTKKGRALDLFSQAKSLGNKTGEYLVSEYLHFCALHPQTLHLSAYASEN